MNYLKIKDLKNNGIPNDEFISNMFYDWFCKDEALANRGKKCLQRLKSLIKAAPHKFNDDWDIDMKNCCGGYSNSLYDAIRVWNDKDLEYAFVPNEVNGGSSYIYRDGDIISFKNWTELKRNIVNS